MSIFTHSLGSTELERYPHQPRLPLQAFDAADEYLLSDLAQSPLGSHERVLLLNDPFGALACALAGRCQLVSSGDSHLGFLALSKNLASNGLSPDSVQFVPADQVPQGPFDRVLIRIPKTLALLEEQLIRLHGQLSAQASVIAAAMIKHLPRAAGDLLERYIGPLQASLAVKKARLLTVRQPILAAQAPRSPYPSSYWLEEPKLLLTNHANVFCREALDIGTRAFLPHLPRNLGSAQVADLGCGNGVLGIVCALNNPEAQLTLVDESYMAVQSARHNWQAALAARPVHIYPADGLSQIAQGSLDLVLCNPPFHQQQVVGDFLAQRMFKQARAALKAGGALLLVGNRHLGYAQSLKRYFTQVQTLAATPKFVILKAV